MQSCRVFNSGQRVMHIHPGQPHYGRSYTIGRYVSGDEVREFQRELGSGRVSQNRHDNFFVQSSDDMSIVDIAHNGDQVKLATVLKRHGSNTIKEETIGTVGKVYAKSDGTGPYYDVKFEGLDAMVSVPSVHLDRISQ